LGERKEGLENEVDKTIGLDSRKQALNLDGLNIFLKKKKPEENPTGRLVFR
jgi:hypothetical protein